MPAALLAALMPGVVQAARAWVDLGTTDSTAGLANSQRGNGTDGENDALATGPSGDVRSARRGRGLSDDDAPDSYLYFVVTDPDVKASRRLRIGATLWDDPAFASAPATVALHYTNLRSTRPGDIPDTFAGHPDRPVLAGSGRWVRHVWALDDAGFRTFQQGTSDFRLDVGPARVAVDRVDVVALPAEIAPEEHLVGAHYYPWYTAGRWNYQECVAGSLRLELRPPQTPVLGKYDSSSATVVDQHIRWCAEHGVNVLLLEFIAPGSREDEISRNVILRHRRIGDLRFAVMYDWAIRFGNGFDLTPERIETARSDFRHLAREYFGHPRHLRFGGEVPVVLIYVTRALSGDIDGLIAALRDGCALEGEDVLIAGDELFFPSSPNASRIRRWDAIFGYDVYAGRGGLWGENGTLSLFTSRTAAYRQTATAEGVKFFPSCAPGFNDRAIRRTCADNPAFSRRRTAGDGPTSLFEETFGSLALGSVDAELPLICVTSFNEWHEDTQIEPTRGTAGSTAADSSPSGDQYTQGLAHDDYGMAFLETIRDATLAVTGRVLRGAAPVADARIEVLDAGGRTVLERRSFTTGAYTVPRLRLRAGSSYTLRASADGLDVESAPVRVLETRTVAGLDLVLVEGALVSRGDCNGDRELDISDPVALLGFLFTGGAVPGCLEACDANDDDAPDLSDAVYLLANVFLGGPPPAAPAFPACAPVVEAIGCPDGNCDG